MRVVDREDGLDERPGQQNGDEGEGQNEWIVGRTPRRRAELDEDGGEARERGGDGERGNGEPADVGEHRLTADMVSLAMAEHPEAEDEVEADADVPADQHARDEAKFAGQYDCHEADGKQADGAG